MYFNDVLLKMQEIQSKRSYTESWIVLRDWLGERAAQQSTHRTALRRGLALSILFNVVLLAVVMFTIGGR